MGKTSDPLSALADPTRRRILELLVGGRLSASEIYREFPIAKQTASKHLQVLHAAELVDVALERQWRYYTLNGPALAEVEQWLSRLHQ